jgi:thiamine pyrophosphokinase
MDEKEVVEYWNWSTLQDFNLIILNRPISNPDRLIRLWSKAKIKVCADGGSNVLYKLNKSLIPDFVIGDFDSLLLESHVYYRARNTKFINITDQDTTDLQKCIKYLLETEKGYQTSVIINAFGGRLDHIMGNINSVFLYKECMKLFLLDEENLTFLLSKGRNDIEIDRKLEGPECGIIPFKNTAIVSSTGLKWDLSLAELSFGQLISTSNLVLEDRVQLTVHRGDYVLWNIKLKY